MLRALVPKRDHTPLATRSRAPDRLYGIFVCVIPLAVGPFRARPPLDCMIVAPAQYISSRDDGCVPPLGLNLLWFSVGCSALAASAIPWRRVLGDHRLHYAFKRRGKLLHRLGRVRCARFCRCLFRLIHGLTFLLPRRLLPALALSKRARFQRADDGIELGYAGLRRVTSCCRLAKIFDHSLQHCRLRHQLVK